LCRLPCSSRVWWVTLTPASWASSSRRRPRPSSTSQRSPRRTEPRRPGVPVRGRPAAAPNLRRPPRPGVLPRRRRGGESGVVIVQVGRRDLARSEHRALTSLGRVRYNRRVRAPRLRTVGRARHDDRI
jgi:hypothetical protein